MHQFDRDILFEPGTPFSYSGHIMENWSINGVPNGGYLMAILAKTMIQVGGMKSARIITANFLNCCAPGDAEVLIEKMSASRQFGRFQARLQQKGKEKIRAFGTFAAENNEWVLNVMKCPPLKLQNWKNVYQFPRFRITRFSVDWMSCWTPFARDGCRKNCPIYQKAEAG